MKKISISMSILILLVSIFTVGCSSLNKSDLEKAEAELSKEEYIVYESLLEGSSVFKNPSSVRILDIGEYMEDLDFIRLVLQAENGFGANGSESYTLYLKDSENGDYSKGDISENYADSLITKNKDMDLSKINNALEKYWQENLSN